VFGKPPNPSLLLRESLPLSPCVASLRVQSKHDAALPGAFVIGDVAPHHATSIGGTEPSAASAIGARSLPPASIAVTPSGRIHGPPVANRPSAELAVVASAA